MFNSTTIYSKQISFERKKYNLILILKYIGLNLLNL